MVRQNRHAFGKNDDSLQGEKLRAFDPWLERRGSRGKLPQRGPAAVGDEHAAIRRQSKIAEYMGLLIARTANDRNRATDGAGLEFDFGERRRPILIRSEPSHRRDRGGRRPQRSS